MKNNRLCHRACSLAAVLLLSSALPPCRASDHADPMSLDAFKVQKDAAANITDLHAFIVDSSGKLVTAGDPTVVGDQLIISLCVVRALQPQQIAGLDLKGYKYRVHLDLQPPVRFFDEKLTREGKNYEKALASSIKDVNDKAAVLKAANDAGYKPMEEKADAEWKAALASRGILIAQHESDRSMQALYGGIVSPPDEIAEAVLIEFELELVKDDEIPENSETKITKVKIQGIPGKVNVVADEKIVDGKVRIAANAFRKGFINVRTGVFDDPFIFPRFFRRNVVGIVTSIPLSSVPLPARHGPALIWATTHNDKGTQIDHVGRSLRTQLPRFGYLNYLHPAEHVKAITRVHEKPDLMEDVLATFLAPIEAHRHYDSAPDVMVYDLTKPARFPNGRWLEDDISKTLADAGETLLFELSYAESKQFPRATTNDKEFLPRFPYLAPRWTMAEIAAHMQPGTTMGNFAVPRAGDPAAIAFANFKDATWHTLWLVEVAAIVLLTVLLLITLRSNVTRVIVGILAVITICMIDAVRAPNLPVTDMKAITQPAMKMCRLLLGFGVIALFKIGWIFALGKRIGERTQATKDRGPAGEQGATAEDRQYKGSTYKEVHDAVFANPYYGTVWGADSQEPLPMHDVSFRTLAQGLLSKRFGLTQAIRRTLDTRADLRWGNDRKGFRRLIHPNGTCLVGEWVIDGVTDDKGGHAPTGYTGYFQEGRKGLIISRHSPARAEPRRGGWRSMGLIGKIYPTLDPKDITLFQPASFFTQEDLGGTRSMSINDSVHINGPDVHAWRRGKGLFSLLLTGIFFTRINVNATIRQLHEIAELTPPGEPEIRNPRCPTFMRLKVDATHADSARVIDGNDLDVRDEILGHIYDKGDPTPKRQLIYTIEVSDHDQNAARTHLTDGLIVRGIPESSWKRIGRIIFKEAVCSHNGDFVIHFHHPKWRKDPNDSKTEAEVK